MIATIATIGKRRRTDTKILPIWLLRVFIGILVILYLIITYWLYWPYKPFIINGPIKVLNTDQIIEAGDYLIYEIDAEKKMPIPATIYKWLINDYIISYTPIIGDIPVGKKIVRVKQKVPQSAEPGIYRFKWEGHYKVNPLRTITVIGWSDAFTIIEKKTQLY